MRSRRIRGAIPYSFFSVTGQSVFFSSCHRLTKIQFVVDSGTSAHNGPTRIISNQQFMCADREVSSDIWHLLLHSTYTTRRIFLRWLLIFLFFWHSFMDGWLFCCYFSSSAIDISLFFTHAFFLPVSRRMKKTKDMSSMIYKWREEEKKKELRKQKKKNSNQIKTQWYGCCHTTPDTTRPPDSNALSSTPHVLLRACRLLYTNTHTNGCATKEWKKKISRSL